MKHKKNDTGLPSEPPETRLQAGLEALRFLIKVCKHKSYARPYLIADAKRGHFATSLTLKREGKGENA